MRKPGMSFERHQVIGALLRKMHEDIVHLSVEFGNSYPRSGKKARPYIMLNKLLKDLNSVKSSAEENYAEEYPKDWDVHTYYGPPNS